MKSIFAMITAFVLSGSAFAESKVTYFSCIVKEKSGTKSINVEVKFAVKNLNLFKGTGSLEQYPGSDEEAGLVSVTPTELPGGRYSMMANLNGQGGDLRIEGNNLRLWGDGDGYQFTDLVVWDADSGEDDKLEGYVRDYGPAYGDNNAKTFKQFINCKRSTTKL